jgi:hypothetical protein
MGGFRVVLIAAALVAACVAPAAASARSSRVATSLTGIVLAADRATNSLYVADARGRVFLVLARRVVPVGSRVQVRGDLSADGWTIVSAGPAGLVTRVGSVSRALVRGQLGFVDVRLRRFQLAVHGQIIAEITFPAKLGPALHHMNFSPPHRGDLIFRLSIRNGRLALLTLPG